MKSASVAILLGLFIGLAVSQIVGAGAANPAQEKATKNETDEYLGPTVDYELDFQIAAQANPKARALREIRGRRYNQRAPEPLAHLPSNWEGYATGTDWYLYVPALPVEKSDAVIVGEVGASEAHLSVDKTGVYSEFSIKVDQILKNHEDSSLNVGELTIGEREGGVVRFQDGRLFRYRVYHQGMPRPSRRYLFFLSRNHEGEDYTIVTAYELRGGQVTPLDQSKAFSSFQGADDQSFLNKVRDEIERTQKPRRERREEK